jgi:hypothetical protein
VPAAVGMPGSLLILHGTCVDALRVLSPGFPTRPRLQLMLAERFDAFLTVDQHLEFQQNIRASGIGVVVVVARTNRLKELRPLVPLMLDALAKVAAGQLIRVGP